VGQLIPGHGFAGPWRGARLGAAIVALLALAAAVALPASAAKRVAGVPSPWTWVDRGPKLNDVSCAPSGHCVAVGVDGAILRTTTTVSVPLAWAHVSVPANQELVSVACRGSLCIAITGGNGTTSGVSRVYRSTDSGRTWSAGRELPPATVAGGRKTSVGTAVACQPSAACVIAGRGGGIWHSTDQGQNFSPLRGSSLGGSYRALACPVDGVCILVGSGRPVALKGTDPTALANPTTATLSAIACESRSTCTAADDAGRVISISSPWTTWQKAVRLPKDLSVVSLSCPSANTCVGLTGAGPVVRTTDRSGGVWTKRPTGTVDLIALDCGGTRCAAVGKAATWYGSGTTGLHWAQVNAVPKQDVVSCPAGAGSGRCVGGGMEFIGRSTTGGDLWTTPVGVKSLSANGASCAGFPTCLVISKDRMLASTDGGRTWHDRRAAGSLSGGPETATCLDANRCVAAGNGNVFTTFDGARTGWHVGSIPTPPGEMFKSIACPTRTVCVLATTNSIYRGQLSTGGGVSWQWLASDADPPEALSGIACSSPSSCTAVGAQGEVLTSTDSTLLHWQLRQIGTGPAVKRPPLLAVACPANGVCIAAGHGGYVATTTTNWATWSLEQVGSSPESGASRPSFKGISCVSTRRCVLVGDTAFVGTR
jgi:photosystem II stability/assembly factor-like uncharacterized protein